MLFFLPLRVLNFPCYVELSLDPKLEFFFFSKKPPENKQTPEDFSKHTVSDAQMSNVTYS